MRKKITVTLIVLELLLIVFLVFGFNIMESNDTRRIKALFPGCKVKEFKGPEKLYLVTGSDGDLWYVIINNTTGNIVEISKTREVK